jgi:hypothetical protein
MPLDNQASVIEKGVPMPPAKGGARHSRVGPYMEKMEIGDSILCEDLDVTYPSFQAWARRHRPSWRIESRKTAEGVRVWRTA